MSEPFGMVPHSVFDAFAARVGITPWAVYTCLVRHARGDRCSPSYDTIANDLGIHRRTAIRAIQTLEVVGLVVRDVTGGSTDGNRPNAYTLPHGRGVVAQSHHPRPKGGGTESPPPQSGGGTESPGVVAQSHQGGGVESLGGGVGPPPLIGIEFNVETKNVKTPPYPPPGGSQSRRSYPADFEQFWKCYPATGGAKRATYDQWRRIPEDERAEVIASLERWKKSQRWQEGYVKHPDRWLRDELWRQPPPPDKRPTTNGPPSRASPNGQPAYRDATAASMAEIRRIARGET